MDDEFKSESIVRTLIKNGGCKINSIRNEELKIIDIDTGDENIIMKL